ncbi:MAG: ATP-binding protein [Chlamydiae bacterium]|nr:ATP-binding protein [Chlamydiota bacterium]
MGSIFVGRQNELDQLQDLWNYNIARFVVIKGRRRIGKSRLVEEFAKRSPKNTKFISLSGLPPSECISEKDQRNEFARQLAQIFSIPTPYSQDWGDLFVHLAYYTREGSFIIFLDEISWMGMKDPTFLGKLKTAWDQRLKKNPKLIVILCGSVSYWIEKNILSHTGFVGRVDLVLTLGELSLKESLLLLGNQAHKLSPYEICKILSITGGIPRYLESILPKYSAEENIKRLCFTRGGLLFREFEQIFSDLFTTKSAVYRAILDCLIQIPHATLEDIFSFLQKEKSGVISQYLEELILAGFVTRDYSWSLKTGKSSKLSQFRICDNYIRFYLKYVYPHKNSIEKEMFQRRALSTFPGWDSIMGLQFENLVMQNRHQLYKILKISPHEIIQEGPYFQRKTTKRSGCQIDYLIQTKYNSFTICEIRFSTKRISPSVVPEVQSKIHALSLPKATSCRPVLIHINGVEDSLIGEEYFASIVDFSELFS